jgi:alkyl sulfatase BDS1-like metallo-beta-lactamase superfamily hydrolase
MRSFEHDAGGTVDGPQGQRVHRDHLAHREVIERRFYAVRPGVWTLVGNGLSNQTFIEAPDGIIAIDTGESVQEMEAALAELREHTQRPVVAVIYTHFHYVEGTKAVLAEPGNASPMPIYAHERVTANKSRTSGEIAPVYARGLVEQFGITLPEEDRPQLGSDVQVRRTGPVAAPVPAAAPFARDRDRDSGSDIGSGRGRG